MSSFIKNNGINGNKEGLSRVKGFAFPTPFTNSNGFTKNGFFGSKSPVMNTNNNFNGNVEKSFKCYNEAREKGVIEKLLTTYGFVQCTDRKGRFFFHYSEYKGSLNNLEIGDAVEFQESLDKRTGKPVAVSLVKVSDKIGDMEGKPVEGIIFSPAQSPSSQMNGGDCVADGRVTYEQGGETFFLPFSSEDVEVGGSTGDKVTFYICTDEVSGNPKAKGIRRLSSSLSSNHCMLSEQIYQGVVCSMKDTYGFIERADVVKEIFFHFSEFEGNIDNLRLGDDVQFAIQTRNNKDVAVELSKLPAGTVVFDDVSKEWKRGKIKKTTKMTSLKKQNEALVGRIVYETLDGSIEIPFGEKDPQGDFTMLVGDIVEFCIATDRRDKVQHATNIRLVDDTFTVVKEKREKGFVTTLKEGFGFIRCTDREARMFFHYSELLNSSQDIHLQDELEFTVVQDPSNVTRLVAIRIKVLPVGTIIVPESSLFGHLQGIIQKEAPNSRPSSLSGCKEPDPGVIMYEVEGTKQMIAYSCSVVDGDLPKLDDKVEFQISECHKNNTKVAVNVKVLFMRGGKERGFVVTIKEMFGFIETADHEREIYFHFSNYEGDVDSLEVGCEVEFTVCNKSGRVSAECIRRISKNSIYPGEVSPSVLEGRVLRSIHSSDSTEYFGLIQLITADTDNSNITYPFSIMSLVDKRDTLMSRGDCVRFQMVEVARQDSSGMKKWAFNVACTRKLVQASVESLHDNGGTLSYEKESGKKLTFSCKDADDMSSLSVGDDVDFVVATVAGEKVAVNVKKSCDRPRPERLISRVKNTTEEQVPRVVTIRQPKGPDGSKGFKSRRISSKRESVVCGGEGLVLSVNKLNGLLGQCGMVDRAGGDALLNEPMKN